MATTPKEVSRLQIPAQPRLPVAPQTYDPVATDQTNNILRLFFNQIVGVFQALFGKDAYGQYTGGRFLTFPYAAVQRNTDQTFTANTATLVALTTTDFANGTANITGDGISVNNTGIYNYQFSIQWANTDTSIQTGYCWLRVYNGTTTVDVAGTASKFDVPAKHGTDHGYLLVSANFYVQLNAGDHVEMWAAVTNANLYMEAYPAQTTPWAMPSIPSVVATLTFVSATPT
jgi:hypothetical protein